MKRILSIVLLLLGASLGLSAGDVRNIDVNGVNLVYEVYGPESGLPVIVLHGNGSSHVKMAYVSEAIARAGYRVYALDSRGQGANVKLSEYHYRDMAEDVWCFINALGLDHPVVYGHSDGGNNAILLELAHPGVTSMIAGSGVNMAPEGVLDESLERWRKRIAEKSDPLTEMMVREPDIRMEQLEAITVPVLLTVGTEDIIKKEHVRDIASRIPLSTLAVFDGETHSGYVRGKELMVDMLLGFIANHTNGPSVEVKTAEVGGESRRYVEEMVPSTDGTRLYTFATQPEEGVKCPTVVMRSPYITKSDGTEDTGGYDLKRLAGARKDVALVNQHCRGRGCSEGRFEPYTTEREDGLSLLRWVRTLPSYNGQIFLVGNSYLSTVHQSYLETDPSDVVGAALYVQCCDRYGVIYRNGCFKIGLHGGWYAKNCHNKDSARVADPSASQTDFPLIDWSGKYFGKSVPSFDSPLMHPRRDDPFWQSDDIGAGYAYRHSVLGSTMPVLLRTAFYDIYTEDMFDMWRELPAERKADCAMIVDAYDHSSKVAAEMKGTIGEFPGGSWKETYRNAEEEWMQWCLDRDKTPEFTGFERGKVSYYALWENKWYTEPDLLDGPKKYTFAFGDGERSYTYDPRRELPEFPGSGGLGFGGMRIQKEPDWRDDVVSFVLPPLKKRLDVRGRMSARLAVRSDCEDTAFYIRLSVKKSDGRWYLLRDDITTLTYDQGSYRSGEERILEYRFPDHAFRLEKGDVLRVDVSSASSFFAPHPNVPGNPNLQRQTRVAHNTVIASHSSITLPCKK